MLLNIDTGMCMYMQIHAHIILALLTKRAYNQWPTNSGENK